MRGGVVLFLGILLVVVFTVYILFFSHKTFEAFQAAGGATASAASTCRDKEDIYIDIFDTYLNNINKLITSSGKETYAAIENRYIESALRNAALDVTTVGQSVKDDMRCLGLKIGTPIKLDEDSITSSPSFINIATDSALNSLIDGAVKVEFEGDNKVRKDYLEYAGQQVRLDRFIPLYQKYFEEVPTEYIRIDRQVKPTLNSPNTINYDAIVFKGADGITTKTYATVRDSIQKKVGAFYDTLLQGFSAKKLGSISARNMYVFGTRGATEAVTNATMDTFLNSMRLCTRFTLSDPYGIDSFFTVTRTVTGATPDKDTYEFRIVKRDAVKRCEQDIVQSFDLGSKTYITSENPKKGDNAANCSEIVTPQMLGLMPARTRNFLSEWAYNRTKRLAEYYHRDKDATTLNQILSGFKKIEPQTEAANFELRINLNSLAQKFYEEMGGKYAIGKIVDISTIGNSIVDVRFDLLKHGDPTAINNRIQALKENFARFKPSEEGTSQSVIDEARASYFQELYNLLDLQDRNIEKTYPGMIGRFFYTKQENSDAILVHGFTLDPAFIGSYNAFLNGGLEPGGREAGGNVGSAESPGYVPLIEYTLNPVPPPPDLTKEDELRAILAEYSDLLYADDMKWKIQQEDPPWPDISGQLFINEINAVQRVWPPAGESVTRGFQVVLRWKESVYDYDTNELADVRISSALTRKFDKVQRQAIFTYKKNTDQWYAADWSFDVSGFYFLPPTTGTAAECRFNLASYRTAYPELTGKGDREVVQYFLDAGKGKRRSPCSSTHPNLLFSPFVYGLLNPSVVTRVGTSSTALTREFLGDYLKKDEARANRLMAPGWTLVPLAQPISIPKTLPYEFQTDTNRGRCPANTCVNPDILYRLMEDNNLSLLWVLQSKEETVGGVKMQVFTKTNILRIRRATTSMPDACEIEADVEILKYRYAKYDETNYKTVKFTKEQIEKIINAGMLPNSITINDIERSFTPSSEGFSTTRDGASGASSAGSSYKLPDPFEYRLVPLDSNPVTIETNKRYTVYLDIDPGDCSFSLKRIDEGGAFIQPNTPLLREPVEYSTRVINDVLRTDATQKAIKDKIDLAFKNVIPIQDNYSNNSVVYRGNIYKESDVTIAEKNAATTANVNKSEVQQVRFKFLRGRGVEGASTNQIELTFIMLFNKNALVRSDGFQYTVTPDPTGQGTSRVYRTFLTNEKGKSIAGATDIETVKVLNPLFRNEDLATINPLTLALGTEIVITPEVPIFIDGFSICAGPNVQNDPTQWRVDVRFSGSEPNEWDNVFSNEINTDLFISSTIPADSLKLTKRENELNTFLHTDDFYSEEAKLLPGIIAPLNERATAAVADVSTKADVLAASTFLAIKKSRKERIVAKYNTYKADPAFITAFNDVGALARFILEFVVPDYADWESYPGLTIQDINDMIAAEKAKGIDAAPTKIQSLESHRLLMYKADNFVEKLAVTFGYINIKAGKAIEDTGSPMIPANYITRDVLRVLYRINMRENGAVLNDTFKTYYTLLTKVGTAEKAQVDRIQGEIDGYALDITRYMNALRNWTVTLYYYKTTNTYKRTQWYRTEYLLWTEYGIYAYNELTYNEDTTNPVNITGDTIIRLFDNNFDFTLNNNKAFSKAPTILNQEWSSITDAPFSRNEPNYGSWDRGTTGGRDPNDITYTTNLARISPPAGFIDNINAYKTALQNYNAKIMELLNNSARQEGVLDRQNQAYLNYINNMPRLEENIRKVNNDSDREVRDDGKYGIKQYNTEKAAHAEKENDYDTAYFGAMEMIAVPAGVKKPTRDPLTVIGAAVINFVGKDYTSGSPWKNTGTLGLPTEPAATRVAEATLPSGMSSPSKSTDGKGVVLIASRYFTFPDINLGNAWSVSVWVKRRGLSGAGACIISQRIGGSANSVNMAVVSNYTAATATATQIGGGFFTANAFSAPQAPLEMPLDIWVHITYTWNGSKLASYFNGTLMEERTLAAGVSSLDSGLEYRIGADWGTTPSTYINAEIGQILIYKSALSSEDVLNIYDITSGDYLVVPAAPPEPTAVLPDTSGPIIQFLSRTYAGSGMWKNDGSLGQTYNATLMGSTSVSRNTESNLAIKLNGSVYFTFPNPALGNTWSVSMWIKRTATGNASAATAFITQQRDARNRVNMAVYTNMGASNGGNANTESLSAAFLNNSATTWTSAQSSTSLPQNAWVFVTYTYDGSKLISYTNGSLANEKPIPGGQAFSLDSGLGYRIGSSWYDTTTRILQSEIGEIRIYRRAIRPTEVLEIFNTTRAAYYLGPNIRFSARDYISGPWTNTGTDSLIRTTAPTNTVNAATVEAGTPSKNAEGNGIVFNGSTNFRFPNIQLGSNPWTVSLWIKRMRIGDNGACYITQIINGNVNMAVFTNIGDTTQGFPNSTQIIGGYHVNGIGWRGTPNPPMNTPLNTWIHASFIWDGQMISAYLNGAYSFQWAPDYAPADSGEAYRIGRRWDVASYIRAEIGEINIYKRALHPTECKQLYDETKGIYLTSKYYASLNMPEIHFKGIEYTSGSWQNSGTLGSTFFPATIEAGSPTKNAEGNGVVLNNLTNFRFSDIELGSTWSVSLWVKRIGLGAAGGCFITQIYETGKTDINMSVCTNDLAATNKQISAGYHKANVWRNMSSGINLDLNNWVFVAFTCNGTTVTSYTHNGTSIATNTSNTNTITQTPVTNNLDYRIGRRWDLPNYIRAEIGEIRVYKRAITAAEVQDIYNATNGIYITRLYLTNLNRPILHLTASSSKYNNATWTNDGTLGSYFNATVEGSNIPILNNAKNAIVFDGNKSFTLPNLELGNRWSVSMWVRRTGNATGDTACFIGQNITAAPNNMAILTNSSSLGASSTQAVAGFLPSTGTWRTSDSLSLPLNSWVHLTYTWDGSTFVSYSDGRCNKIKAIVSSDVAQDNGTGYLIGRRSDQMQYINADIGEIQIYRRAISATEVANIYDQRKSTYMSTGLRTPEILFKASTYTGSGPWTNEGTESLIRATAPTNTVNAATIEAGTPTKNAEGNGVVFNGATNFTFPNIALGSSSFTVSMWIKQLNVGNENACYLTQLVKNKLTSSQLAFGDILDYYNRSVNMTISQTQNLRQILGRYFVGRYVFSRLYLQRWSTIREGWYSTNTTDTPINTWIHVSYVWDGANFNLYSNGVYVNRITPDLPPEDSGEWYRIGRGWDANSTFYINSEIGEVRIDKVALTGSEIVSLYNNSAITYGRSLLNASVCIPTTPESIIPPPSNNIISFKAINYNTATKVWHNDGSRGSTHNAVASGSPTLNVEGNGIVFDGSTNFTFSNATLGANWSVSLWVKRTGTNGPGSSFITQIAGGTGNDRAINMAVYTNLTGNGANAGADQVGGGFYTAGSWRNPPGAIDLPLNRWVHLIYIWDGTKISSYVNNAYAYAATLSFSPNDSGQDYRIGRSADEASTEYIRAEIGEIVIYNSAITRTEISEIYNTTKGTYFTKAYLDSTAELPIIKFTAAQINTPDETGTPGRLTNTGTLEYDYNATLANGTFVKNTEGNGIVFNGSTSFTFRNPALGNAWSICLWVKRTGANTPGSCYVAQIQSVGFNSLAVLASQGQVSAGFLFNTSVRSSETSDLSFNKWVHITYTWDGTTLTSYLDGMTPRTSRPTAFSVDSGQQFQIGGDWNTNPGGYIRSEIGEIRIYNRSISAQEVTNIYNETRPTYYIDPVINLSAMMYPDNDNTDYNFWYNLGSLGGRYSAVLEGTTRPRKNEQKNGVVFNGSANSFKIPNLKLDNAWSVSMWVKRTSDTNPAGASFITQIGGNANYDVNTASSTSLLTDTVVNMGVNLTGTNIVGRYYRSGAWRNTSTYTMPLGTWVHLTYTWNGRDYNTYLNGYLINTTRQTYSTTDRRSLDSGKEYRIGRGTDISTAFTDGEYLSGEIGQILIYDFAISSDEVTRIYDQTKYIYLAEKAMNPCLLLGRASVDGAKRLYSPDECRRLGGKYLAADKCILVDEVDYKLRITRYDEVNSTFLFPRAQNTELYQRFRDKSFYFNKVSTTDTETYVLTFDSSQPDTTYLYGKIALFTNPGVSLTDGFDLEPKENPIVAYTKVDPIINICRMCAGNNTNRAYLAFINSLSSLLTTRNNTMLSLTKNSIPTRGWYSYNRQPFNRTSKVPFPQMFNRPRSVFECLSIMRRASNINAIGDYIFNTYSSGSYTSPASPIQGYNAESKVIGRAFLTGFDSYFMQYISKTDNRIYLKITVDMFPINRAKESRALLIQIKFEPRALCDVSLTADNITILQSAATLAGLTSVPTGSTYTKFTETVSVNQLNAEMVKWGGYPEAELPVSLEVCAGRREFFVNDYSMIEVVGRAIYDTYSSGAYTSPPTPVQGYSAASPHLGRAFLLGIDSYTFRKSATEPATNLLTLIPRFATITDKYVVTNYTGDTTPIHIVLTIWQPGYTCNFTPLITNVEIVRNRTKDFYGAASNVIAFPTTIRNRPENLPAWGFFLDRATYPESMTPQTYTKYTGVEIVEKSQDVVFPILSAIDAYGLDRKVNNAQIDNVSEEGIAQYLRAYPACEMFQMIRDIPRAILYRNYNLSLKTSTTNDIYIRTSSSYKILRDLTFTVTKVRNSAGGKGSIGKMGIYRGGMPNTISSTATIEIVTSSNTLRAATATEQADIRGLFTYTNTNSIWTFDYPTVKGFKLSFSDTPILANGFSFSTGYSSPDADPVQWKLESSSVTGGILEEQTTDYATPTQRLTTVPIFIFSGDATATHSSTDPLEPSVGLSVGTLQTPAIRDIILKKLSTFTGTSQPNIPFQNNFNVINSIHIIGFSYDSAANTALLEYDEPSQPGDKQVMIKVAKSYGDFNTNDQISSDIVSSEIIPLTNMSINRLSTPSTYIDLTETRWIRIKFISNQSGTSLGLNNRIYFYPMQNDIVVGLQDPFFKNIISKWTGEMYIFYYKYEGNIKYIFNKIGLKSGDEPRQSPKSWIIEKSSDGVFWYEVQRYTATDTEIPTTQNTLYPSEYTFGQTPLRVSPQERSNMTIVSTPSSMAVRYFRFFPLKSRNNQASGGKVRIQKLTLWDASTSSATGTRSYQYNNATSYMKKGNEFLYTPSLETLIGRYAEFDLGTSKNVVGFHLSLDNAADTSFDPLEWIIMASADNTNYYYFYHHKPTNYTITPVQPCELPITFREDMGIPPLYPNPESTDDCRFTEQNTLTTCMQNFSGGIQNTTILTMIINELYKAEPSMNTSPPTMNIIGATYDAATRIATCEYNIRNEDTRIRYRKAARIDPSRFPCSLITVAKPFPITLLSEAPAVSIIPSLENEPMTSIRFLRFRPLAVVSAGNRVQLSKIVFFRGAGDTYQPMAAQSATVTNPYRQSDSDVAKTIYTGGTSRPTEVWEADIGSYILIELTTAAAQQAAASYTGFTLLTGTTISAAPKQWALEYSNDGLIWRRLHTQDTDFQPPEQAYSKYFHFYFDKNKLPVDRGITIEGFAALPPKRIKDYSDNPALGQRFGIPQRNDSALSTLYTLPLKQEAPKEAFINRHLDTPAAVTTAAQPPRTQQLSYFKYLRFRPLRTRGENAPVRASRFVLFDELQKPIEFNARRVKASNPMGTWRGAAADIFGPAAKGVWEDAHRSALIFAFTEPIVMTGLQFSTGAGAGPGDPVRWKIEGSQNGTYWETLHDQSRSDFPVGSEGATVWF